VPRPPVKWRGGAFAQEGPAAETHWRSDTIDAEVTVSTVQSMEDVMLRHCVVFALAALFVASAADASQPADKKKTTKKTHASCFTMLTKKGYTPHAASFWCEKHGY
jgi:hypothetical protein